jgi:hypothetical protein
LIRPNGRTYISHVSNRAMIASLSLRSLLTLQCDALPGGAPLGSLTLLSRFIQPHYTQRCYPWTFLGGEFNNIPASPMLERLIGFGGLHTDRLAQVNGGIDSWQYTYVPIFTFCLLGTDQQGRCVHSPIELKEQRHCSVLII